jgi:glycosyltransferase involved in cell wall biosynthesis
MKVAFNCRCFLKKKKTGIGRYAFHLIDQIKDLDADNQYILYAPKRLLDLKRRSPRIHAPNFTIKKDYFRRGLYKTVGDIDVYHAPCSEFLQEPEGYKVVVTIHDLIFKTCPNVHTQKTIDMLEAQMKTIVDKADRIICISKSTADDLLKYYPVNEDKVRLIYNGVDKNIFYEMSAEQKDTARKRLKAKGVTEPYLLFVGTLEPRKNLRGLLEAFRMLKERNGFTGKVVVVGMKGWLVDGLDDFVRQLKIKNDVIFLGYTTNDELRYLYNLAEAFVFPSFYEGFGFPIVEAFCCGAPVVTSNFSSPAEIAGDCAITIDPYEPEQIFLALKELTDNPQKRDELRAKGKKRAELFSFLKTAQETVKVYKELA